ncbi:MAG: hypothetical protein KGM18_05355 [Sphingomonadales bacterium]|nr:hypothetical protein [Sphingomonadales bacterium]
MAGEPVVVEPGDTVQSIIAKQAAQRQKPSNQAAPNAESGKAEARVYGPVEPVAMPVPGSDSGNGQRLMPPPPGKREIQWRDVRKWELTYLALNAIDAGQTVACLNSKHCSESNPLLGSRPSTGTVVGFKAGIGLLHFLLVRASYKSNPKAALTAAKISTFIQGGVVGLNTRYAF